MLNFNKLKTEIDIESTIPDSCECKDYKYYYQPAGDLKNIRILELYLLPVKDLNTGFNRL